MNKISPCLLFLASVTIAITVLGAPVEEPEDLYLRTFSIIQQADALSTNGKTAQALAKYHEAHTNLVNLQRFNRDWNEKTVSFRMHYVAERVAALSGKGTEASSDKAASGTSTPQVKLLQAGAEPRKVLRLHPKPGDKQTMAMSLIMSMSMKAGEMESPPMKLPTMSMNMEVTTKDVSADGNITYEMVMSDATVTEEPGVLPQVTEAIKGSLASFKNMNGTGSISSRGLNLASEMKLPPETNPQTRQMMEQMKDSFSNLGVPLPEEAVGAGAKWESRTLLKSQGLNINQTATYELVSIEDERVTTKTSVSQSAANQKIENPSMPGMKMELSKMAANGNGNIILNLNQVLPAEGTVDLKSDLSMTMDMGGTKQPMNMKMDLGVRLQTK